MSKWTWLEWLVLLLATLVVASTTYIDFKALKHPVATSQIGNK